MRRLPIVVFMLLCTLSRAQMQRETVELLKSADWEKALTRIVSDRTRLAPSIIACLEHDEALVRAKAAAAIRAIDSVDLEARSEDEEGIGGERGKAVSALVKTARDANAQVRRESIWALAYLLRNRSWGHHGEPWSDAKEVQPLVQLGKAATPALVDLLGREDPNDEVLYGTKIGILRVLGATKDPQAIDALIAAVKTSSHFQLSEAMKALSQFEDPRVVPTLIDRLDESINSYSDTPGIWALMKIKERAIPQLVLAITEHPKASVRFRAAHFFEHVKDPRAVAALQRATGDTDEYVRASAAASLGHNPDPGSAAFLLPLLGDASKLPRSAAATSLGALKVVQAYEPVARLLADKEPDVRRAAVYALPNLDAKRAIPALIAQLKDKELQGTVIAAIKPFKPLEAEVALIEVVKSGETYAQNDAADLLGEMKSVKAVPVLLERIADEDWYPRTAAVRALGMIGEPAVEGLLKLIPKASEGVLWDSLIALGSTKDPRAFDVISPYLDNAKVREGALEALGKSGDKRAIPLVLKYLESQEGDLLRYAVEAAGNLKSVEAVPLLIKALSFDGDYVANNAAEALGKIGDKRAFDDLLKVSQNREFSGRWMAIEALGSFADSRAVPVLIKLLEEDWPDSAAAARALGKIGDRSAIPALEKATKSDDERLADDARAALEAIRQKK